MDIGYSVARRAVLRGRISSTGKGRSLRLSWPQAKFQFEDHRDESKSRDGKQDKKNGAESGNGFNLFSARAEKETYLAQIRKLDFLERSGELVDAKLVEDRLFNVSRQIRDALLNIPDRVSSVLAAEADPARCHDIVSREIERVIEDLTKSWKL